MAGKVINLPSRDQERRQACRAFLKDALHALAHEVERAADDRDPVRMAAAVCELDRVRKLLRPA